MAQEVFVEWEARYSVGIPTVDEQHKELLRLTNELYNACLRGDEAARERFKEVIKSTVNYVSFHFSSEEKLMESLKYPDIEIHKKEHERFVKKVVGDVKAFEEGKAFVPNTFVRFLRDWILTHIAMEDIKYADYIHHLKQKSRE
jgi:hemerythrin